MPRYEVQTRFTYGWENCWTGDEKPLTFATRKEAQEELKQHCIDMQGAVESGDIKDFNPDDLRVAQCPTDHSWLNKIIASQAEYYGLTVEAFAKRSEFNAQLCEDVAECDE